MNRFETDTLDSWLNMREALRSKLTYDSPDPDARDTIAAQLILAARLDAVRHQLNHGITTYVPEV